MSELLGKSLELSLILLLEIAAVLLLGLIFIPLLRSRKTGKFDWKICSRFKTDGSEPTMGGLVSAFAFSVCFFPLAFRYPLNASSNYQDTHTGLISCGIFAVMIMLVGLAEDRLKHFLGRPAGIKPLFKQMLIFALCFVLLVVLTLNSRANTEVLLPFRLGYIEFGVLYYPLMALAMTLTINVFKLHFCFGSDLGTSVGGLIEADGAVALLTVSVCSQICSSKGAGLVSLCASACCIGMLIWTFSPSKLISGESGALLIGALFSASVILSKLELLLALAALPQTADAFTAAVHYAAFRSRRKKRTLTENFKPRQSLRMLFAEKGAGDRLIIFLFLILGLISAVISLMFAVYSRSFALNY